MSSAPIKRLTKKEKLELFTKNYKKITRIVFEDEDDVEEFKTLMPHFKDYVDPTEYKAVYNNVDADYSRADDFKQILKEAKEELEQACAPVDDVNKEDDDDEDAMHDVETKSDRDFVADEVEYTDEKAKKKAERRLKKGADAEEYRQQQNLEDAEEEKQFVDRVTIKPAAAATRVLPAATFGQAASKRTSYMDTKDITADIVEINDSDEEMNGTESDNPEQEDGEEAEAKPNSKKRAKTSSSAAAKTTTEARIYQFGETFVYKGNEYKVTDIARPGYENPPLVQVEGKLQPDWDNILYQHLTTVYGRNPNKKDVVDYHNFVQADGMIPAFVTAEKAKRIDNGYKNIPNQVHPYMDDARKCDNLKRFKNGAIRTLMCMANYRQLTGSKEKKSVTANRLGTVKVTPQNREQASHCLTLMRTEFASAVEQFEKGFKPKSEEFDTSEYLTNLQEGLELLANIKKTNNLCNDFMKHFDKTDPEFLKKFIVFASILFPGWRKINENYLTSI